MQCRIEVLIVIMIRNTFCNLSLGQLRTSNFVDKYNNKLKTWWLAKKGVGTCMYSEKNNI